MSKTKNNKIDNMNEDESFNKKEEILKLLNVDNININQEKRKRGRPRKNQIVESKQSIETESNEDSDDHEIILELKLNEKDVRHVLCNDDYTQDDILVDNDTSDNNKINIKTEKEEIKDLDIEKNTKKKSLKTNKISKKNVISNVETIEKNCEIVNNKVILSKQVYSKLINTIKIQQKELINKDDYLNKINPMYSSTTEKSFIDMQIYNYDDNGEKKLTPCQFSCWYCTLEFNCIPIYLPETYSSGKFFVRPALFHSFNCASAYNLALDDDRVNIRSSLLKKMLYKIRKNNSEDINNITDIKITPAQDPRYKLKKYGIGNMTEEEYLLSLNIECENYINVPELVPVSGNLEIVYNNESRDTTRKQSVKKSLLDRIETA